MLLSALSAAVLSLAATMQALAEPPTMPNGSWQPLPGPPPAHTGKPRLPAPASAARDDAAVCPPALPCGARLLGTVRKNGAIELQVPALRW